MDLYLIIGRHMFYVYRRSAQGFESESIDGNSFYRYDLHNINRSTQELIHKIADNNNLDDSSQMNFIVVENEDKIRNHNVEVMLETRLKRRIALNDLILRAISDLSKDPLKHISDFGVNYDGSSYILRDGDLEKRSYSLLALSIDQNLLLQYI